MSDKIVQEISNLVPSAIIELFELDVTPLGGNIQRFHAGTNELTNDIVWAGNTYIALPIEATGFEYTGEGTLPRPILRVANIFGTISTLIRDFNDLVGAKVTRIRTFAKYLDSVNFQDPNPNADPFAEFTREIYYIDRKSIETNSLVEFELSSSWDVQGIKLPRRQIIQNVCTWIYRSSECGYAGPDVADINDNLVGDLLYDGVDRCGLRIKSCKIRFGEFNQLPYGGFPGAGLSRY